MGGIVALMFNGAVCDWNELPQANDTENMKKVYAALDRRNGVSFFCVNKLKLIIKKVLK